MLRAALLDSLPQAIAQLFRALRAGEQSFEESSQIKPGASAHDRQPASRRNLTHNLPGHPRIFTGRNRGRGIHAIEQVVRNFGARRSARLGRTDLEITVHGYRIAVDYLAAGFAGDRQRQRSFAAGRGADDDNQQGITVRRGQRKTLQLM